MPDTGPAVAVTGASGFLGSLIVRSLARRGYPVVALSRSGAQPDLAGVSGRRYELADDAPAGLLEGTGTVVHCAWDLRCTEAEEAWETNVRGSIRLFRAALEAGVGRFVFVSSMSAYPGTKQSYGLMKLAVERPVLDQGHHVVRPGLVYGAGAGGMSGALERFARLPVWPDFRGARQFTVHQDDLVSALVRLLASTDAWQGRVVGLAHPTPVTLQRLLTVLAGRQAPRPRVPVPALPLRAALRAGELAGLRLPFRSDSLLGLVRPAPAVPGQDVCEALGIAFRDLEGGHRPDPEPLPRP